MVFVDPSEIVQIWILLFFLFSFFRQGEHPYFADGKMGAQSFFLDRCRGCERFFYSVFGPPLRRKSRGFPRFLPHLFSEDLVRASACSFGNLAFFFLLGHHLLWVVCPLPGRRLLFLALSGSIPSTPGYLSRARLRVIRVFPPPPPP